MLGYSLIMSQLKKNPNPKFVGDYERFDNAMSGKGAFDATPGEKTPVVVPWYVDKKKNTSEAGRAKKS